MIGLLSSLSRNEEAGCLRGGIYVKNEALHGFDLSNTIMTIVPRRGLAPVSTDSSLGRAEETLTDSGVTPQDWCTPSESIRTPLSTGTPSTRTLQH